MTDYRLPVEAIREERDELLLRATAAERERDEALAKLDEVEAQAAMMWAELDSLARGCSGDLDLFHGLDREVREAAVWRAVAAQESDAGRALLARVATMEQVLRVAVENIKAETQPLPRWAAALLWNSEEALKP